ncbi:MAG: nucleotidyltransferase domain-containing protein [Nanoarchaeota archaeon]|nr:nucleotidyltransferase domain-containing protein [Nanoarchaeota archaeon]
MEEIEIDKLLQKIKRKFVPSEKEEKRMSAVSGWIVSYLQRSASRQGLNVKIELGGSYAKHTWVKGSSDIDVFVTFNSEDETKKLRSLVPQGFYPEHGTREYFVGKVKGVNIQIVPVVSFENIESVKNSIDFSVLHKDYVLNHTNQRQREDIILLKQFCKANSCYGSETYLHGFSGYVLELLIIHYGSLKALFLDAQNWEPGMFIDIEHVYQSKEEAVKQIGAKDNPLIIVDPTNKHRNVCGSLNLDNFSRFVFSVIRFVNDPDESFFQIKDERKEIVKESKRRGTLLYRVSKRISDPRERFLSQYVHKVDESVKELRSGYVDVYDYHLIVNEKKVDTFIEIVPFSSVKIVRVLGPTLWIDTKNILAFLKQHKGSYLYHDRLAYDLVLKASDINKFISKVIKKLN